MTAFHLIMFMIGAFVMMIGLHNSIQLSIHPVSRKIREHRQYQNVYAASGILLILGLVLMCSALRELSPF